MVESGKPKSSVPKSTHQISVSSTVGETKKSNKNDVSFDEVLDDLKSLDDIKTEAPTGPLSKRIALRDSDDSDSRTSDTDVLPALDAAPMLGSDHRDMSAKGNAGVNDAKSSKAKSPAQARPRPIRTTDGMVSGTVRRNNLAPITKRPLGVPIEQRNTHVVTAPRIRPVDEDEDETSSNPLLAAFWTKKRLIIGGAAIVTLAVVVGLTLLIVNKSSAPVADETTEEEDVKQDVVVDYDQKITDASGESLDATHQLDTEDDLAVLFTDLTCKDQTCSNISNVKIGITALTRGTDYTTSLQDGKLLFTLKASRLNALKVGTYALTFELVDDKEVAKIGLKFNITASEKGDEDDTDEDSSAGSDGSSTSRPSTSTTTPSTSSSSSGNTSGSTGTSGGNTGGSSGNSGGTTGGNTGTDPDDGDDDTTGDDGDDGEGDGDDDKKDEEEDKTNPVTE